MGCQLLGGHVASLAAALWYADASPMNPMPAVERISSVLLRYAGPVGLQHDPAEFVALIAGLMRDITGGDRASIWLRDEASLYTRVAHGAGEIRVPLASGLVGACVASGEPVLVNDARNDPRFDASVDRSTGYVTRSLLTVPMRTSSGEVIGACQILNKPGGFQEEDIGLALFAASYSATAFETQGLRRQAESARRLARDLEIARAVQQRLLPANPPDFPGLEAAGACHPALDVGGDFYNFIRRPDGRFAIVMGDIAGKGVAASLLMASLHASLNALLTRDKLPLATLVAALNAHFREHAEPPHYSTLFLAEFDPDDGLLRYVNAGHLAPLLASAGAPLAALDGGGPPVGLLPRMVYRETAVEFPPGATLFAFTDGLPESIDTAGEEWGDERLAASLRENAPLGPRKVVEAMLAEAHSFAAGAPQHDDMTALAVRRADQS